MITLRNIAWSAGLIEGEGSFQVYQSDGKYSGPRITVTMTDLDVVKMLPMIWGLGAVRGPIILGAGRKHQWSWRINGKNAISVTMTILPFLGKRRKARAIEMIRVWRQAKLGRNKYSTDIPWKQRAA